MNIKEELMEFVIKNPNFTNNDLFDEFAPKYNSWLVFEAMEELELEGKLT